MQKPTFWQKAQYWFDNLMSKGTASLLLVLAVVTAIVVVAGGLISIAIGGADGSSTASPGTSVWYTLMHAINTGVLAKEEGTVPYLFVMTIVTLVGIFITSFLIGTISNGIKDKVASLQRGHSLVIEQGHIVIIGFDGNVTSIIEELALANENQKDAVVVVMADHSKPDMEETIRESVPDLGNLKVICRSGKPDSLSDLGVCALGTCKSVIVNLSDDFMTVKTILACKSLLDETNNDDAFITAVIRDVETLQPAKIAGGKRAEILNFQKTVARLMVQASRHPGMSEIISELLSFKGNEVYIEQVAGSVGMTLRQLNLSLPRSIAIGVVRGKQLLLNPGAAFTVQEDDALVLIAGDDEITHLQETAAPDEAAWQVESNQTEEPHTLLVLGYSDMLPQILSEEDSHSAPGSRVIVATEAGRVDADALPGADDLRNIEIDLRECRLFKRKVLESLVAEEPESILIMSDPDLSAEEADSRTIMLQLHLNDIAESIGADVPLIIEINSTRNQRLSQMMRATDFVVNSRVTSKMMVQVAENRHKKDVLGDLLSDGGSSIYMKPATRYVRAGQPATFHSIGASAARYDEVAIGYKRRRDDATFDIVMNPRGADTVTFSADDDLIVVAKH